MGEENTSEQGKFAAFLENRYPFLVLAVSLFAAFLLFYKLGALPVQDWDEARCGVSAYEMAHSGDFTVTTWLSKPDYWSSKPPLAIQAQALSIRAFGDTIFAMRFPSALAGLLIILLTMKIARDLFGKTASLFAGVFLCTSYGFMNLHAMRSGNYDALFTLFVTLSVFALSRAGRNAWAIPLLGLSASLAFLTKSFAVFQVFGIALVYLAATGVWKKVPLPQWLIAALLFGAPIAFWAHFRFWTDGAAFFQAMVQNDLLQRTTAGVDGLPTFVLWYAVVLLGEFFPWSLLALGAFLKGSAFSRESSADGRHALKIALSPIFDRPLVFIWAAVPFLLFSLATTKVDWYMIPVYPALAAAAGWLVSGWFRRGRVFRFFTPARITLSVLALAALYVAALVFTVGSQEKQTWQNALLSLPRADGAEITFLNRGRNQAEVYVAHALRGYRVSGVTNSAEAFLASAGPNDVLYAEATPAFRALVSSNRLRIVSDSFGVMAAKK